MIRRVSVCFRPLAVAVDRPESVQGGLERGRVAAPAFGSDQLQPRRLGRRHDLALAVDDGDEAEVVGEQQDGLLRDHRAKLEAGNGSEDVDTTTEALWPSDDDESVELVYERFPGVGLPLESGPVVEELDAVGQVLGDALEPALPVGVGRGLGGGADVYADRVPGAALCGDAVHGRGVAALLLRTGEGLHVQGIVVRWHLRRVHTAHHARTVTRVGNRAGDRVVWRSVKGRSSISDTSGTGVSPRDLGGVPCPLNKIHMDMVKPREVVLRGTAADLSREGLDMMQGTRTLRQAHTKAPAVAATARTSLRSGAFFAFPRRSGCGRTSAPEGGEME